MPRQATQSQAVPSEPIGTEYNRRNSRRASAHRDRGRHESRAHGSELEPTVDGPGVVQVR